MWVLKEEEEADKERLKKKNLTLNIMDFKGKCECTLNLKWNPSLNSKL